MSKHTKGPWTFNGPIISGTYRVSILGGTKHSAIGYIEKELDAQFIAMAPELLEACRESLYALTEGDQYNKMAQIKRLKFLISKAEGNGNE